MAPYRVQQVVATGYANPLIASRINLPSPAQELLTIQKTVLIDRADVTLGNVLLQGRLRACYTLAGAPDTSGRPPTPPGVTQVWHAPVTAVWAETGFCLAIALAEAQPDLAAEVSEAHVTAQVVTPQSDREGRLLSLDDQSMLQLAVRLIRTVDLHPPPPDPPRTCEGPGRGSAYTRFDSRTSR